MPNKDDEETHKKAIIATAAKLIKSGIKKMVKPLDEYPKTSELELNTAYEYIPQSLRLILSSLFVGKDTRLKEAGIGQAIVQAVRPRMVIAPLQIGLAVQMHHHFRSKFLIDTLFSFGYCSSYSETLRFEENAASVVSSNVLGCVSALDRKGQHNESN